MNPHLKQRLVGAIVLVVLGIVILPMLLERTEPLKPEPEITNIRLPAGQKEVKSERRQAIPEEVTARYESPEKSPATRTPDPVFQKEKKPAVVSQEKEKNTTIKNKPENRSNKPLVKTENSRQWAVQLGSFSSRENANRLVHRLESEKLSAYFEKLESNGKTIYRVRVGPFDTKQKTEKMKEKLDRQEKLKTLIVTLH